MEWKQFIFATSLTFKQAVRIEVQFLTNSWYFVSGLIIYFITFTTADKQAVVGVAQQSKAPN